MKFGVTLPNIGVGDDPHTLVDLAVEAEAAGWDGIVIWDWPGGGAEWEDERLLAAHEAWIVLALIAERTERITIGTLITPLAWRQPWMVARQAMTLDRLSSGRFVLSVGLGAPPTSGPHPFGEEVDRRIRARRLDEGLEILRGLWSGEPFSFDGKYYRVNDAVFRPVPSRPIPVWVVGAWQRDPKAWPSRRSMRRALRWDGILPHVFDGAKMAEGALEPDDIRAMCKWIGAEREAAFDVVIESGSTDDTNTPVETVRGIAEAGATWWLEPVWWSMYKHPGDPEPMRLRIRQGPPTL